MSPSPSSAGFLVATVSSLTTPESSQHDERTRTVKTKATNASVASASASRASGGRKKASSPFISLPADDAVNPHRSFQPSKAKTGVRASLVSSKRSGINNKGRETMASSPSSSYPFQAEHRDEETIIRQGHLETALLSSPRRDEVEASVTKYGLYGTNDDDDDDDDEIISEELLLNDVDANSILQDILYSGDSNTNFFSLPSNGESGRSTTTNPTKTQDTNTTSNRVSVNLNNDASLHVICEHSRTLEEFLQGASLHLSARAAGSQDSQGKTPLHCLSLNPHLAKATLSKAHRILLEEADDSQDNGHAIGNRLVAAPSFSDGSAHSTDDALEREFVEFVVSELWMRAYRPSMITPDKDGFIPFQEALTNWVRDAHYQQVQDTLTLSPSGRNTFWASRVRSRWSAAAAAASANFGTESKGEGSPEPTERSTSSLPTGANTNTPPRTTTLLGTTRTVARAFPSVRLTPQVIFCFTLLSAIIERVDEHLMTAKPLRRRLEQKIDAATAAKGTNNGDNASQGGVSHALFHEAVHKLRTMTVEDIGSEIMQSIASIPDLVKTVLLIEDRRQREYVMSTLVMRRVLARKYSVGGWLTKMLSCGSKRVSDRGIEYLKIVSDPELFETNAPNKQSSWRRSKSFRRSISNMSSMDLGGGDDKSTHKNAEQDELYSEVSNLQDFVPSLLSLGEWDLEDVATAQIVRKVLDQLISRPFAATVIMCDALLLILLITGIRLSTNNLLLGAPVNTVVNYLYIANTGLFYFLIRELGKAVSLLMVTKRARIYFWSFWNVCDMFSIFLALASIVSVRQFCNSSTTGSVVGAPLRNLISITTGFLWLRVLSFLKGINEQLATFVLCILTIMRDVTWFCVILVTLVVAFAQMFFTVMVPASCADPTVPEYNGECTPYEYYLMVYSVLVGSFHQEDFKTAFSIILAVFFSFTVVLVFLNVLIAVASDSYERCLIRSANLFGRARVMLIAELVSFQNLLRRNVDESRAPRRVYNAWWSSGINGWSRGSVMFFTLAFVIVLSWVILDLLWIFLFGRYGNVLLGLGSILINILLFVGIMIFLSTGAMDISQRTKNTSSEEEPAHSSRFCGEWYGRFLQGIVMRLLGSSSSTSERHTAVDNWHGRLLYLQNEMVRIADESNEETTQKILALEKIIQQSDSRLRSELSSLENNINDLKSLLQNTLAAQHN